MASAGKLYVREIYSRFQYLAAWLPNANLSLGDVGVHEGGRFKRMSALKDLGLPFRVRIGTNPIDFTYTSESGVTVATKIGGKVAAGTSLPLGQADISIQFSRKGAFLFQAIGCSTEEIEDKMALGQVIIRLVKEGSWEPSWAVVDTLVRADTATIVLSNSRTGAVELTAKAPVSVANLANVAVGLSVTSQTGDIIRFIAAKGLSPLFRLSKVKQSFLSKIVGGTEGITFGGADSDDEVSAEGNENPLEAVVP